MDVDAKVGILQYAQTWIITMSIIMSGTILISRSLPAYAVDFPVACLRNSTTCVVAVPNKAAEERLLDRYKTAAAQGNARAEYSLGDIYLNGYGNNIPNFHKALYWFKKAARQGNVKAEIAMALNTTGTTSAYWYKKAARQGSPEGEYFFGADYYYGKGISHDSKKAIYWLSKAQAHGYPYAAELLKHAEEQ